jgi:RNA polymerase sigma-70 factor (ECF subfamily)
MMLLFESSPTDLAEGTRQDRAGTESRLDPTDEQIMCLIQRRTRNGLKLLHARYAGVLKDLSMQVLDNDSAADALIQDVFLEIWHRADSYDPMKGQPFSWLATLTTRSALDHLRRESNAASYSETARSAQASAH